VGGPSSFCDATTILRDDEGQSEISRHVGKLPMMAIDGIRACTKIAALTRNRR